MLQQQQPALGPLQLQLLIEKQLFHFMLAITNLQAQLLLTQGRGQRGEVVKPFIFDGTHEAVVGFINSCQLYQRMRMGLAGEMEKITWVLTYVQGEVVEV